MTILPAKRTASTSEETTEANQQTNNADRTVRRRDEIGNLAESSPTNRRSQFSYGKTPSERKDRLRKRYKEPDRPRDREREREKNREVRREQKRERVAKREPSEPLNLLDNNVNQSADTTSTGEATCNKNEPNVASKEDDCTGFNSEDEYDDPFGVKDRNIPDEEWQKRDDYFARGMSNLGFEIKQMNEDGACLFRCIADQVYGDQEFHYQVRQDCMNYIVQNRDYFEPYVTEDFDKYVARKKRWNVHGNHLEIQAMSELYNRTIEVYCYQIKPINIFSCSRMISSYEPIRLSYHRMCHYNSISNPNKPSVGVGLGLPNYHTVDINRLRFNDAVRASDELLIEQTMLEDKLKATDWEATNEAIEEQVARESYIQYFRDSERRLKNEGNSLGCASSSTITSAMVSSPRSRRGGSASPKGSQSPKNSFSLPTNSFTAVPEETAEQTTATASPSPKPEDISFPSAVLNASPKHNNETALNDFVPAATFASEEFKFDQQPGPSCSFTDSMGLEDMDQEIMAQVLAESQKTYLDDLKHKNSRWGSPGPSTSSQFS